MIKQYVKKVIADAHNRQCKPIKSYEETELLNLWGIVTVQNDNCTIGMYGYRL